MQMEWKKQNPSVYTLVAGSGSVKMRNKYDTLQGCTSVLVKGAVLEQRKSRRGHKGKSELILILVNISGCPLCARHCYELFI